MLLLFPSDRDILLKFEMMGLRKRQDGKLGVIKKEGKKRKKTKEEEEEEEENAGATSLIAVD